MQVLDLTSLDLETRLGKVLHRLRFLPDRNFLEKFPYGSQLVEAAKQFGGVEKIFENLGGEKYFDAATVEIPSPEQQLAATEIALAGLENRKRFEFSKPGTRKTIGVLSAIPLINEILTKELREREKVKTLICCPTYIIPTWIREAERLLKDPNIVVVTRRNRQYSIKKAAKDDTDIVLLGYELSYRRSGIDTTDPEISKEMDERYIELLSKVFTEEEGYRILGNIVGREQIELYKRKRRNLDQIIEKIVLEEKNAEAASIATALRLNVFNPERPYYAILDEIHNVIDPNSATARALAEIFRPAKWGALVSGTGIRNQISNVAYEFYLMGIIEDPKDFTTIFRDNPKIVRAVLDIYSNPIRTLRDVDQNVKDPVLIDVSYELTSQEMDLYIGLINSTLFEGRERYLLLNYLLTNPRKLLPENFTDTEKEDSLKNRLEKFFEENPVLRGYAETTPPSKLAVTKKIIEEAKSRNKKIIVACEYSTNLTSFLERELQEYGCIRIDQTVHAQPEEIELTNNEIRTLTEKKLYEQGQKFRSDLSLRGRQLLGIRTHEIWGPSPRELALLEHQTNPEKSVLVVSYGTLREGVEATEASILEEYESTTVPAKFEQLLARILRSGKEDVVEVYQPRAANTFEEAKYKFRNWKAYLIDLVFRGENATAEELEEFLADTRPEKSREIGSLLNINSRAIVAFMFNNLRGRGVERFVEEMSAHGNALFLAKNYNHEWNSSYSANCARLISDVVLGLENKIGRKLEDIVDEGCGPSTISRIIGRRVTCIDINRFQLDYGIDACDELGIKDNKYYLGSYTDLRNLIPHSEENKVFNPKKTYERNESLEDNSIDTVICSLALDFATEEERKQFFNENKKVLRKNGYLIIVEPTSKIDESCRKTFLEDMEDIGFEIDKELTGTYKSRRVLNLDTKEYQKNGFEAYVIVAKKTDEDLPQYQQDRSYFRMLNEYRIIDGNLDSERDTVRKEARIRRLQCSDFINTDSNVDPKKIEPKPGAPPIHPELLAIEKEIRGSPEEDLAALEAALRRLIEN